MTIPLPPVIALLFMVFAAGCTRPPEPENGDQAPSPSPVSEISAPDQATSRESLTWTEPVIEFTDDEAAAVLTKAGQALADGRLYQEEDAAIPLYLALRRYPDSRSAANTGLLRATRALLTQGNTALQRAQDDAEALQQAQQTAAVLRAIQPVLEDINAGAVLTEIGTLLQQLDLTEQVWELNFEGERELQAGHLGEQGGGALARFILLTDLMM